jgi:hypothetical protein
MQHSGSRVKVGVIVWRECGRGRIHGCMMTARDTSAWGGADWMVGAHGPLKSAMTAQHWCGDERRLLGYRQWDTGKPP